jgi:hypothetical protein
MIVNKITTGYVIQEYDTVKKRFISQEFIAGDQVDFEAADLSESNVEPFDAYFPFEMKQPSPKRKQ